MNAHRIPGRRWLRAGLLLGTAVALALPPAAGFGAASVVQAQDGKRGDVLSWADAPEVPRYRFQADWLVDVGRETTQEAYGPFPTHPYAVGDAELFVPLGSPNGATQTFVVAYRSEHAYFWFERGQTPDPDALQRTVDFFESHIFPLNTRIYGGVSGDGIDADPRIHIVNQQIIGPGILGAFNPEDQCPRTSCPESNQRDIIYLSLDEAVLGSDDYLTTLAHEHQHLIQFDADGNEQRWLNEALSQLAEHFNGFSPTIIGGANVPSFLENPDHDLLGWAYGMQSTGAYYGAGYLFLVYLYERFGLDLIQTVARSPLEGLASIQAALDAEGRNVRVDDIVADWFVANLLDDPYAGDGRYYYQTLDLPEPVQRQRLFALPTGYLASDSVHQYGADYLTLDDDGAYTLHFDGSDEAGLVSASPYSGRWMWWSLNEDSSAARLTGAFDLSGLTTATLAFSGWWEIEEGYDWFQVLVSADGGQSWDVVGGPRASTRGTRAPGPYYTGQTRGWVEEQIDLSAYAGQPVLIRFEYLTDASQALQGVVLDDLGIVELGPLDDVESPDSPWVPDGFLRIPASVPQSWAVRLVIDAPGATPDVQAIPLDLLGKGEADFTIPPGGSATIIVGALAPFTTARGTYLVELQRTAS